MALGFHTFLRRLDSPARFLGPALELRWWVSLGSPGHLRVTGAAQFCGYPVETAND